MEQEIEGGGDRRREGGDRRKLSNNYGDHICQLTILLDCSIIDLDKVCQELVDLTAISQSDRDAIELSTQTEKITNGE